MRKLFIMFAIGNIAFHYSFAQCTTCANFLTSLALCENNVNQSWSSDYNDIKRATFKFSMTGAGAGNCTGVLINQYVQENQLHQYFLTANHCLFNTDLTTQYYFLFNYQSRDANSCNVPAVNQGCANNPPQQSDGITVTNGYQCYFTSSIRIVDNWFIGDMALCEIINPIPPNFNVYYAGWQTHSGVPGFMFNSTFGPFALIHHPSGDIKKISITNSLAATDDVINTGCTIITTVFDAIFCIFGLCNINIEIVCNYVDIPFYNVLYWNIGTSETGSSGAPLFNKNFQVIGNLSGGKLSICPGVNVVEPISKFKNFYRWENVHKNLNPTNNWNASTWGIGSHQHNCYDNLTLGVQNYTINGHTEAIGGEWYPLRNYQANNHLELHANNDINITGQLHIHDGSDYTLSAGGDINGTGEITVDNVNDLTLTPGSSANNCNTSSYKKAPQEPSPLDYIRDIVASLPKSKKFDVNEHPDIAALKVYPNPTGGLLNVSVLSERNYTLQIFDLMGKEIYSNAVKCDGLLHEHKNILDISNYADGFYMIKVQTEDGKIWNQKVIKQ